MLKRFVQILCIVLLFGNAAEAQSHQNTTISLLTVSPGSELYSLFGHSAIRIQNTIEGYDRVFNYGTFDFDTPNFTLLFVSGRLDYILAENTFGQIYRSSEWENRALYEQVLNLTNEQKTRMIDFLNNNILPQNRTYRYDFLKDNCATRIRDVIEYSINDSTIFNKAKTDYPPLTYRQLLATFLTDYPWVHFGIDLAMGLPADEKTDNSQKMFLPDYMKAIVAASKLSNGENLVYGSRTLLTQYNDPIDSYNFLTPISIFFAIMTLSLIGFSSPRYSRIFCSVFYFILGVLGIIISLLTFATDHDAMRDNLNLLWALPFSIFFFRQAGKKAVGKIAKYYFAAAGIIASLLLILWKINPQQFNSAVIPILLTIVFTSSQIVFQRPLAAKAKQAKAQKSGAKERKLKK